MYYPKYVQTPKVVRYFIEILIVKPVTQEYLGIQVKYCIFPIQFPKIWLRLILKLTILEEKLNI